MPINQLPAKGDKNWGNTLNNWLGQLGPASLGGIHNGDTASRPAGLTADDEGRVYIDTESQELLTWDGSAWQVLLVGNVEQSYTILSKNQTESPYSITASECNGYYGFSNDTAADLVQFRLPPAQAGYKVTILNAEDGQTVEILAEDGDIIYTQKTLPTGTQKVKSINKAESITLYCINDTEWMTHESANDRINEGWMDRLVYFTGLVYGGGTVGGVGNSSTFVYDTLAESWSTGQDMTGAKRCILASTTVLENALAVGGYNAGAEYSDVDSYSKSTSSWSHKNNFERNIKGARAVSLNDIGFLFGGQNGSTYLNINKSYNITNDVWTAAQNMTTSRVGHATASFLNKGYVCGGRESNGVYLSTLDEYTTSSDSWLSKQDMPSPARVWISSAVVSSAAYVFGGYSGTANLPYNDRYDFSLDSWTRKTNIPGIARHDIGSTNILEKAYIFGGDNGGSSYYSDAAEYTAETDSWVTKPNMPEARGDTPGVTAV